MESKAEADPLIALIKETKEVKRTEVKDENAQAIKELTNKLEEIEKSRRFKI